MGVILLIVAVASLNIVGTLILVVLTRGRDRHQKAEPGSAKVRAVFMLGHSDRGCGGDLRDGPWTARQPRP